MISKRDELRQKYDELTGEKFSDRCHAVLKYRAETAEAERDLLFSAIADRFPVEDWTDPRKGITELEAHLSAFSRAAGGSRD